MEIKSINQDPLKLALIISIWVNLAFTILKELTPVLKSGVKIIDNHWVGHTIYSVVFFFLLMGIFQALKVKVNLEAHFAKILNFSFGTSLVVFTAFYLVHSHALD